MTRTGDDEALLALARGVVGISTRAADLLGAVSVVQLRALTVLRDLGTAPLRELAVRIGVTVSTTSRLVDRLVTAGLVDRAPSDRSRREVALRVAPAGQAALDRYDDLRLTELRAGLDLLPQEERDVVVPALAAFAAALGGTPVGTT
jgi:DNA-binding MarR family transcriptional regulator